MLTSFHQIDLRGTLRRCLGWLTTGLGHLLGAAVVFAVSSWLLIPTESRDALQEAYHHGVVESMTTEILLHAGLSACFWALLFIGFQLLRIPTADDAARMVKSRGTVIVETLIVFPVFLLLTMGLMQLALLNTAALLTTLGAFHAGRTAAVWYPEARAPRLEVDMGTADDKIQMAAAAAVAPAVPSDFIAECNQNSRTLDARLEALEDLGHENQPSVRDDATLSLAAAFDGADMSSRGLNKLSFAHCATEVDYEPGGDPADGPAPIDVRVVYHHQLAVPFVNSIFGSGDKIAGRTAHYSEIVRTHSTTMQVPPNPELPGCSGGWLC